MGGFCGSIHSDISTMIHKVPIPLILFMTTITLSVIHGVGVQNINSYRGAKKFSHIFDILSCICAPEHFAVDVNGFI
jgi:hypothetical protein